MKGATHLFEEPGALDEAASAATASTFTADSPADCSDGEEFCAGAEPSV